MTVGAVATDLQCRNMSITSLRTLANAALRLVRLRRRWVAAACAAISMAAALHVLRPPEPPSVPVLVARGDLSAGSTLRDADVEVARVSADVVPTGAYTARRSAVGRSLTGPMRAGEVVTDVRILHPGLLAGYPAGSALSTVRVADAATLVGVRTGDLVDVVAADPAARTAPRVVAQRAAVAALRSPGTDAGTGAGTDAGTDAGTEGAVITLVVSERIALVLAGAAGSFRLSVLPVS